MIEIKLNGRNTTLPQSQTLADYLRSRQITTETRGIAVAHNGRIVPRTVWEEYLLHAGDEVEVIHAVAGG